MAADDRVAAVDHLHRNHRVLAAAVFKQALVDATATIQPVARRRMAAAWLTTPGNEGRRFWCAVGGLDEGRVAASF